MRTLIALLFLLLVSSAGVAFAQSDKSQITPERVGELVSQLTPEQQQVLGQLLEILASGEAPLPTEASPKEPDFRASLASAWEQYRSYIAQRIAGLIEAFSGAATALYKMFAGRESGNLVFLGGLGLTLMLGVLVEFIAERFIRTSREAGTHQGASTYANAESLWEQLVTLLHSLGRDLTGQITFSIGALIGIQIAFTNETDAHLATVFVFFAIMVFRFSSAILRFVLAPFEPKYRLVTTDDWTAKFIYFHLVAVATVTGVGLFLVSIMERLSVPGGASLAFLAGIVIYGGIIYVTWRGRRGLTSILKGREAQLSPGLERMAAWWPPFSIALIAFQYFATQFAAATGALEISAGDAVTVLAIIVAAPFLDTMMRGLVRHLVPPMQGEGPIAEAAYLQTRHSYVRIGRVILFALLVVIMGRLLGISLDSFSETGLGVQFAAKGFGFLMIVAVGYLIWELVNLVVNRRLVNDRWEQVTGEAAEHGEGYGAGKSRMATILPLIRMALQASVIILTALLALGQLGVNITPLLAGAGVVGLAIGFGAQTLVKDVVSGIFFLLDDAFRVGEYIDSGGVMGTVEKISVRSLQLRHPNGPVHIVPYGEVKKLTNHSRDYVIMKLKFTVPFDTDLEKVRKLFKKIGQELMDDPNVAGDFIQPFKSQGVAEVNDVGIVLRGKFMAKPGTQWVIRKQVYARVQRAFEENGIHFARREVRVQLGDRSEGELATSDRQAIAAAAASAATNNP
jgi:small-conductance mechanosensitive channel